MKVKSIFILLISFTLTSFAPIDKKDKTNYTSVEFFLNEYLKDFHPNIAFNELVFVSIKKQKLFYLKNGKVVKSFSISTSKYGIGGAMYSKKTPIGLHKIQNKLGNGTPVNGIIKSGMFSGKIAQIVTEPKALTEDFLTTRILKLMGQELGVNKGPKVDSFKRAIYIHGTPEEGLIGKPASHGCVRMKNSDVLDLYNRVSFGAQVLILNQ